MPAAIIAGERRNKGMLLETKNLSKKYTAGLIRDSSVEAVRDVCLCIEEGEMLGLIGESGCGKSTLTKMILGLLKPTAGEIIYDEKINLTKVSQSRWRLLRKEIQCVFQHPQMTFNPQRNLYFSCAEPLRLFHMADRSEEEKQIRRMAEEVGISFDQMKKYPHEISGGQAQRISIARALALKPRLLLCDEPTSMLDVSVQAQILQMLLNANQKQNVAMLFISHDLEVVEQMCSRVVVMKNGEIVETGPTQEVFTHPQCEYTKKLLAARITF